MRMSQRSRKLVAGLDVPPEVSKEVRQVGLPRVM
jgi:hypothetical protein